MIIQPPQQWLPIVGAIYNTVDNRSPDQLVLTLQQLDVAHAPRYQPQHQPGGAMRTYCNIYLWDATTVLCQQDQVPHWVDAVGAVGFQPNHVTRHELSALGCIEWMRESGASHGWSKVSPEEARMAAQHGRPACVFWENPTHYLSSHVAMLLPSPDPGPQLIAQAGAECFFGHPLAAGFGSLGPLEYWTHL